MRVLERVHLCNAEPVPGARTPRLATTTPTPQKTTVHVYGEGPNAGFTVMDALCHDGMGSVMLDSATVDIAGATFSVGGMAIENGMMEIAAGTTCWLQPVQMVVPTRPNSR